MAFGFGDINPPIKAQGAYKDGGGMGGGGMYMRQGKKRKDQPDEDLFEYKEESDDNGIFSEKELKEADIPMESAFNKFVNWFRNKI